MKILLLNFNSTQKINLMSAFKGTEYKNCSFYHSSSIGIAKDSSYWHEIEFIIYHGNPNVNLISTIVKNTVERIPVLFVTDDIKDKVSQKLIDVIWGNYLPEKEITSFVLEKCIQISCEKLELLNKLKKSEDTQKELKLREAKFRDLFDNSSVGMFEVDKNGNFILANQMFLKILGLKEYSDLTELNAFEKGISLNNNRENLKTLLLKKGCVYNFENEWLKADKTKILVKENIIAKEDTTGSVSYYQGVVEDITARKEVETELVKSKKDAEKSDKLKSEFLTQISHEIRTPVNTLLSFASLIKEDIFNYLSSELKDSFTSMDRAGKRIIRTIDLLIKMSELHTENYEPEFKENDLIKLFEKLLKVYQPLAKEKNLSLQFIKGLDSAISVFDYLTMYDVFSNIIDNAIKFTAEGTVKIYIKNTLTNKISVTVIDTGVGISEKYIGNIFQTFSQETSGYTRKFDGNGLGLALVKAYCDLNNADIFVSSEKYNGSNFTVIFN